MTRTSFSAVPSEIFLPVTVSAVEGTLVNINPELQNPRVTPARTAPPPFPHQTSLITATPHEADALDPPSTVVLIVKVRR